MVLSNWVHKRKILSSYLQSKYTSEGNIPAHMPSVPLVYPCSKIEGTHKLLCKLKSNYILILDAYCLNEYKTKHVNENIYFIISDNKM